jgi:anti-anti-sigma factor
MDSVEPNDRADGDGGSLTGNLLREVREQLAEIAAAAAEGELVIRLWSPSSGLCIASLSGEMDMANADELRRALAGGLPAAPFRLIVEVSGLTFIDSTGINMLATVAREVEGSGGTIALVGPTSNVARVFEMVSLHELLPVTDSLEAALHVPSGRPPTQPTA